MSTRPLPPLPDPSVVEQVRWPPSPDAAIRWTHPGGTTRVVPSRIDRADLLRTIRRYRSRVPAEQQTGWPKFCRRVALPLVRCELPTRPLRDFETVRQGLISRGALWVVIAASFAAGFGLWRLTGEVARLATGPLFGGFFASFRWWANRGNRPQIVATPPGSLCYAALYLAVAGATVPLMFPAVQRPESRWAWPEWQAFAVCAIPALICCGAVMSVLIRISEAFEAERDADAAEEWDALHADPQREPRWLVELRGVGAALPTQSDPDAGSVRVAEN